ncbi:MBL fold metallo-hydrolase [Pseudonocardia acaciae]|uniref:MBL fold metallo-hydrolase n=1 Tax=Pseudonocardia acaciae TaxID=551276 RepID=UPI00048C949F|nr:MBL fold metallo-hydrolase [Pseudonocardia acaciae]
MSVDVWYAGGPTAVLELGGVRLVVDPTFDPPGDYPIGDRKLTKLAGPAFGPAEIGRVDAVLLSHDQHPDNLDGAGREYLATVPTVLSTNAAAGRLGGNVRAVPNWTDVELGPVRVTGVPAQHGPDGTEALVGEVTGFVLSGDGLPTVYVSGDNASLPVVREVARRIGPVQVAVLFAGAARTELVPGGPLTLTSEDAAEAAEILAAEQVVPLHFEGWAHFTEGAEELRAAFGRRGLAERFHLPRPGERVTV